MGEGRGAGHEHTARRVVSQAFAKKGGAKGATRGKKAGFSGTYSSRMKLPRDMPPQLAPAMRLPARLSRLWRLALSRLALFMEMGFGPALTKESWRLRPMAESIEGPVVMSVS